VLRGLSIYHGKRGSGVSVEFQLKNGRKLERPVKGERMDYPHTSLTILRLGLSNVVYRNQ